MPKRQSPTGRELFIVDNRDEEWKAVRYLHDWCQISKAVDVASAYFEIGGLLALRGEWQKVDKIRILMGEEVSLRTRDAFAQGLRRMHHKLDQSLGFGACNGVTRLPGKTDFTGVSDPRVPGVAKGFDP